MSGAIPANPPTPAEPAVVDLAPADVMTAAESVDYTPVTGTTTDVSALHQALNSVEDQAAAIGGQVADRLVRLHNFLLPAHQEVDAIATAIDRLANP